MKYLTCLVSVFVIYSFDVSEASDFINFTYEQDGETVDGSIPADLIPTLHRKILQEKMKDRFKAALVFNEDGSVTYSDPKIYYRGSLKWIKAEGVKKWMFEDRGPDAHDAICKILGYSESFDERIYQPETEIAPRTRAYHWGFQVGREHVAVDADFNVQASYSSDYTHYGYRNQNSLVASGSCR